MSRHPLTDEFEAAAAASLADIDGDYPKAGLVAMARKSGPHLYGWVEEVDAENGLLTMLHVEPRTSSLARLDFAENGLHVVMDDITSIRQIGPAEVPTHPFAGA